jgi:hypothetical protein
MLLPLACLFPFQVLLLDGFFNSFFSALIHIHRASVGRIADGEQTPVRFARQGGSMVFGDLGAFGTYRALGGISLTVTRRETSRRHEEMFRVQVLMSSDEF